MRKSLAMFSLFLLFTNTSLLIADQLTIISPHRKSIQNEFVPVFKNWYKSQYKQDIIVEWIDQGGTNDDLRFVRSKFQQNTKTSGIDIFWGGGTTPFLELHHEKRLQRLNLPKALESLVPTEIGGVMMINKDKTFAATAISSFGIFFNKPLVKIYKLKEAATWTDLADPKFKDRLVLTDPRKSGTANQMNTILLQALGWERGFEVLTAIAGNTRQFTQSSSDPIKAVVSGDAAATMAIDFYALAKIGDIGSDKLGFILPASQTILDPDPIAILKGAPNRKEADRFVEFVLSEEAQKLLMLPKGTAGGPKHETLGRLAINTDAYKSTEGRRIVPFNPFEAKNFLKIDIEQTAKIRQPFDDLFGAMFIDTHKQLKEAWARVIAKGSKPEHLTALAKVPVTQAELQVLAKKWSDNVFRNETINKWVKFSQEKYAAVAK